MEDGAPNGQGYNRCDFVVECTRYGREVKSRQINEEKAETETATEETDKAAPEAEKTDADAADAATPETDQA